MFHENLVRLHPVSWRVMARATSVAVHTIHTISTAAMGMTRPHVHTLTRTRLLPHSLDEASGATPETHQHARLLANSGEGESLRNAKRACEWS